MDFAGPAQVFYEANQIGKFQLDIQFVSAGNKIKTEQGICFSKLQSMNSVKLRAGDLICIPGVDFNSFKKGEIDRSIVKATKWLLHQKEKEVFICSICSGALILGKMGLLNHVECTTHWKCIPYMKTHFPKVKVVENRLYCFSNNIFTSAGMTAGIDMALALIEKWDNPLVAAKVAQEMVINIRRADTKTQKNIFLDFKNHFNADVYKAQELLANRLDARFTIDLLAKELNMSTRHLSRLFKDHTGLTIQNYRDTVRLEHGENLLLNTEKNDSGNCNSMWF